jgi:putative sigma-54 modulation protein
MITAIEITGVQYDVDETTRKYVTKKIGRLDRYLPRHARKTASVEVKLREVNRDHGNKYEAEIIFQVPDKNPTVNMLAAIDIIEAKIMTQLRKYKQETIAHIGRRGAMGRFKRSYAREL